MDVGGPGIDRPGDTTRRRARRRPPRRRTPRWRRREEGDGPEPRGIAFPRGWAVLAVALGLMALVAALSGASALRADNRPGVRGAKSAAVAGGVIPSPPETTAPSTTPLPASELPTSGGQTSDRGDAGAATGPAPSGAVTAVTLPGPGSDPGGSSTAPAVLTTPATTDDTTTTITITAPSATTAAGTGGTPVATTVTTATRPYPGAGNIAAPTVSASYPAAGGTDVTATASWAGAETLRLTISCPGGPSATRSGLSPLSVQVDDASATGACTVTLSVTAATWAGSDAVAYTLSITPPAGA